MKTFTLAIAICSALSFPNQIHVLTYKKKSIIASNFKQQPLLRGVKKQTNKPNLDHHFIAGDNDDTLFSPQPPFPDELLSIAKYGGNIRVQSAFAQYCIVWKYAASLKGLHYRVGNVC